MLIDGLPLLDVGHQTYVLLSLPLSYIISKSHDPLKLQGAYIQRFELELQSLLSVVDTEAIKNIYNIVPCRKKNSNDILNSL